MNMETELYKNRSLSSCLKTAFILFITNFPRIFKAVWLPSLLCSVLEGLLVYQIIDIAFTIKPIPAIPFYTWLILPVLLCVYTWFNASVFALLNGFTPKTNLRKSAVMMSVYLLLMVFIGAVTAATNIGLDKLMLTDKVNMSAYILVKVLINVALFVLAIIFYLPFIQPFYRYMLATNESFGKIFKPSYQKGLRHLSFLFGVSFFGFILYSIFKFFITLPETIVVFAKTLSLQGQVLGDPSGLPSYFDEMTLVVLCIGAFISMIFSVWVYFVMYYAYGTVEIRAEEKKKTTQAYEKTEDTIY